jgi:hypothetical protein
VRRVEEVPARSDARRALGRLRRVDRCVGALGHAPRERLRRERLVACVKRGYARRAALSSGSCTPSARCEPVVGPPYRAAGELMTRLRKSEFRTPNDV